ncbi:unnamed protein product [Pleuronectes platessa]|uniref:Uncharacterized protein n=1 Tax=Pleuronectes platessa TaxID=8262 RepID=A0A9N7YJT2_PLEPL|nr:unnamed protein product [Pleuronectes platessa]
MANPLFLAVEESTTKPAVKHHGLCTKLRECLACFLTQRDLSNSTFVPVNYLHDIRHFGNVSIRMIEHHNRSMPDLEGEMYRSKNACRPGCIVLGLSEELMGMARTGREFSGSCELASLRPGLPGVWRNGRDLCTK